MEEVFAGFVCGYILALLTTPLLAVQLVRLRAGSELLGRLLPAGVPAVGLAVILHGGLFLFWTAAGMLLGLLLLAMGDTDPLAGSAHPAFSLFVLGLTFLVTAPVIVLLARLRLAVIVLTLAVVGVFGWLMPHMAGWTDFSKPAPPPRPHYDVYHAALPAGAAAEK